MYTGVSTVTAASGRVGARAVGREVAYRRHASHLRHLLLCAQLPVVIDGVAQLWTVVTPAPGVSVAGGAVTMTWNSRAYLVVLDGASCPQAFSPALFATRFSLLGRRLNFTQDVSALGCGCDGGPFFVVSATSRCFRGRNSCTALMRTA